MRGAEGAPEDTRVILHIDLDCFYAQVEHRRLGIPQTVPLAVQQWDGLIAVNYPARAAGVTRHMRVADAKKQCPDITLVHVETIGDSGASTADDGTTTTAANAAARLTQKACLERYRRANAEIMAVLHRLAPTAVIEKASIDEVYIDVTGMVEAELEGLEGSGGAGGSGGDACAWGAIVLGPSPLDPGSAIDRRLAAGAGIACRLRGAVNEKLGFTSSAGIACNKLLAKIGSAMHKPNQMTCIPPRAVPTLMETLPLKKLRNFGGKLGARLEEELGCSTAGQVAALPFSTLEAAFGAESARWIAAAVRGRSDDPVEERERPKSMLAAKSFGPTSDHAVLRRWIGILAAELAPRMATDENEHRRRARTLKVHFRGGAAPGTERSRQGAMPTAPSGGPPGAEAIAAAAWEIFKARCAAEALLGCNRLAISAADFADLPAPGKSAITKFLVAKTATAATEESGSGGGGGGGQKREAEPVAEQQQVKEEAPPAKMAKREGSAAPAAGDAGVGVAELPAELSGVDLAEQRRLLKELELMKALEDAKKKKKKEGGSGKTGSKSGNSGGNNGAAGSRSITQFFARKG